MAEPIFLSDVIYDFTEYLEVEKNRSPKTAENYNHYLSRLIEFAGDIQLSNLNEELIRKWRLWLARYKDAYGQEISKTTQSYHLIALRSFLKYCSKRGLSDLAATR